MKSSSGSGLQLGLGYLMKLIPAPARPAAAAAALLGPLNLSQLCPGAHTHIHTHAHSHTHAHQAHISYALEPIGCWETLLTLQLLACLIARLSISHLPPKSF